MSPLRVFIYASCLFSARMFAQENASPVPPELAPQVTAIKKQIERGDFAAAEAGYRKVLEAVPDNFYLLANLGIVLFRERKYRDAEEVFGKAIAVNPEDGFARCTLGIVYYNQGRYDESVETLTKALTINYKDATAHNYLGITLGLKGERDAAVKELEAAVRLAPEYADAHYNLAVVYATMAPPDKVKAHAEYEHAVKLGVARDPALEPLVGWQQGTDAAKPSPRTAPFKLGE
jgi:tetratricopeptide (TPR) repeat protein